MTPGIRYVGFYPGKWRNSLTRLSLPAEGLMIRICAYRWDSGKNVPANHVEGARLVGVNHNQFKKHLEELINAGELRVENGYVISDQAEKSMNFDAWANNLADHIAKRGQPRYAEPDGPCIHRGCAGHYEIVRQGDCSCHIAPPCGACVGAPLICSECGHDVYPED